MITMAGQAGRAGRAGRFFLPILPFLPLLPVLLFTACTHAQAKTVPDGPPLAMPAPPPREVVAMEVEAPPPAAPAEEPAKPTAPRPRPAVPRVEAAKPEAPAPEPARRPEDVAKPPAPTNLQTTPSTAEGELERSIRESLTRATADLARIDYRALNADARSQYDTAKRFIEQAEDAVRAKNLVFARNLADKAAGLAAQLAGR